MNKLPFFLLLALALTTSCNKTETQSGTQSPALVAPVVSPTATLQPSISQTVTNEQANVTKEAATPNKSTATETRTFIQSVYQKAMESPTAAANEILVPTDVIKKPTFFYDETPIGKYFAKNIKQSEIFTVIPSLLDAITITGKEGTVITLPPASLVDEMGNPVTSPFQIELKECYSTKDILASNLTTTCNDMILETDGMIYVNATCNGKQLRLLPMQPIMIEMPSKEKKAGMELFYGEKRPASGVMNWRVADTRNRNTIGNEMRKDWAKIGESTPIYELGDLELIINLEANKNLDGKPTVSFQIKNIDPRLEKYKEVIASTLNKVRWENDDETRASGKALYEYKQNCLLGGVMFANLKDLLALRDEIGKYKNFTLKKKIPLQAHIDKDLYYKKVGLINNYSFDKATWEADKKFFAANFKKAENSKASFFDNLIAEIQAKKDELMNAYTAHYAVSYLFTANQMGWINCDRFDQNAGERTDLMVKYENKNNMDVKLILSDDRSLLPGRDMGKNVVFGALPKGRKAVVMATKIMNDMPYFAFKEVRLGEDRKVEMTNYRQMSMDELQKELIRLGIAS